VSRNYRILLVAVVAVLAVGGYWKLLLSPKREQAAQLEQQVATQQAQLAQTQSLIATYAGARDAYKTNYATVVRLGKAVTTDDDTRSLVVQLDAAAKRSGVDFDTINLEGNGGNPSTSTTAATSTTPGAINAGAFSALPFSFAFTGTFQSLGNFFSRLENFVALDGDKIRVNGRLLRIETISLQPATDGWPGLAAQVGASAYIVPQTTASTTTPSTTSPAPSTSSATATTSTAAQPG
jgi:Tfp pilus assembly protein PilO